MGGLRNRFFKDEIGYEDIISDNLQRAFEEYITANFGISGFGIDERWGGVMGNTIDGLPLVGSLPHNSSVLAMVGFNGHGFGMAMVTARDLARAVPTEYHHAIQASVGDRWGYRRMMPAGSAMLAVGMLCGGLALVCLVWGLRSFHFSEPTVY